MILFYLRTIIESNCKNEAVPQPYVCPRCYLSTRIKAHMVRHFSRKSPCACKNEIHLQLSEEIKNIVLRDRIYHIPKEQINTVVNNNIMNNYFSGPLDKIRALTEYRNTKMLTLDESIDSKCFDKKTEI